MPVRKSPRLGSIFRLLDAAHLALGEALDLRLQDPRRFAERADGSPIPFVETGDPLLGFAEFARFNRLQELVPAQMDIELRPVDERTVRIDRKVSQDGLRLPSQGMNRIQRHVQHPMFRASDEELFPDEIGVDDVAPAPVTAEGEADTAEQVRHLWRLHVVDLDHVKAVLRPDVCGPHPLGDLVGVGGRPGKEEVKGSRTGWHGARSSARRSSSA